MVIDADTQLVVVVGSPLPGNHNDCTAYTDPGTEHAVRNATVIADGGYRGTSAIVPHRRKDKTVPLIGSRTAGPG